MHFHDVAARQTKTLAPGADARTFWGDNILLSIVDFEPHSEVPSHTHPHEQGGMLLEGDLEMMIAGESRMLKPGDVYIIPGNVEHLARTRASRARVLDIFSPVREELKY